MSTLDQQLVVMCPLSEAATRLRHFFRQHGNADGDAARLNLRALVDAAGLPIPGPFERVVVATIQPHRLPADMTPRYRVQWAPETPGPFPLFAGELLVDSVEDYDTFRLRLSGEYTPPLGILGKGFDAVLGHRIAQTTATDLLRRIKAFIEEEYQADEERKRIVRKKQMDAFDPKDAEVQ